MAHSKDEALLAAAAAGQSDQISKLITAGASPSTHSEAGFTPLAIAVHKNHVETAIALLDVSDVNSASNNGTTPLMLAAANGNGQLVAALLQRGAHVNKSSRHGDTALLWAAASGSVETVTALVEAGADVNASNSDGLTPLMAAAMVPSASCVDLLLRAGATVTARDAYGRSAVTYVIGAIQGIRLQPLENVKPIQCSDSKAEAIECERQLLAAYSVAVESAEASLLPPTVKKSKAAKAHERRRLRRLAEQEKRAAAQKEGRVSPVVEPAVSPAASIPSPQPSRTVQQPTTPKLISPVDPVVHESEKDSLQPWRVVVRRRPGTSQQQREREREPANSETRAVQPITAPLISPCLSCAELNLAFHRQCPVAEDLDISVGNVLGSGLESLSMAQLTALYEFHQRMMAVCTEEMLQLARRQERERLSTSTP